MVILYNLNHEQYLKVINYLYKHCDTVAFMLPNYNAKHYSTVLTDKKTLETTRIEPYEVKRNSEAYINYKNNVLPLLNEIRESIREVYTATNYFGKIYTYELETYVLTFNDSVFEMLNRYENFSIWRCPSLPEDLMFFNHIDLVASAITHEDELEIHENSQELLDLLKEAHISFREFEDEPV